MRVIRTGRQCGKTTEIIKIAAEAGAYIVCPNPQQADRIYRMARDMGIDIKRPIVWREFLTQDVVRGKRIPGYVIDDLDQCIQQMTYAPVVAVSMNGETR